MRRLSNIRFAALCLLALLLTHCAGSRPLYYWGGYEDSVYVMEVTPEELDPQVEIARLSEHIERARSRDLQLPPGFYAQLGYLYALAGDGRQAESYFLLEKERFPESAKFIDGVLSRMKSK